MSRAPGRRRPGAADAPGVTALLLLFSGWEAASGGSPAWLRIGAALIAMASAVSLVRFAVWRARGGDGDADRG
ncbi:hypothetical protein ACF07V_27490 [Streptomyces sp. NPDC015661]|uniref:hypothetical protein n=1 Tax=Streptomyces sp. NPDC015661 TaxID=3364961 RepID=UPI003700D2B6